MLDLLNVEYPYNVQTCAKRYLGSFCEYQCADYVLSLCKTKELKDRKQTNSKYRLIPGYQKKAFQYLQKDPILDIIPTCILYQTWKTVISISRRELKIWWTAEYSISNELWGIWKCGQTLLALSFWMIYM